MTAVFFIFEIKPKIRYYEKTIIIIIVNCFIIFLWRL